MLFIFTLGINRGSCWEMLTSACHLFCSRLRLPHPPSHVSHWIQPETAITCAQWQKCWNHLILLTVSLPCNFSHSLSRKNIWAFKGRLNSWGKLEKCANFLLQSFFYFKRNLTATKGKQRQTTLLKDTCRDTWVNSLHALSRKCHHPFPSW